MFMFDQTVAFDFEICKRKKNYSEIFFEWAKICKIQHFSILLLIIKFK